MDLLVLCGRRALPYESLFLQSSTCCLSHLLSSPLPFLVLIVFTPALPRADSHTTFSQLPSFLLTL